MDSSQTDEFFDDWGSPGFRDQLFRNVALAEKQVEQIHENSRSSKPTHTHPRERSGTSLQVFRDPQSHTDRVVASPQQQQHQVLREINLNQHDINSNNNDNQNKFEKEGLENTIKQVNTIIATTTTTTIDPPSPIRIDIVSPINIATEDRQLSVIDDDINDIEADEDEEMWGLELDVDLPSLINDLERNTNNGDKQEEQQQQSLSENFNDDDQPKRDETLIDTPFNKKQMELTLKQYNGFMTAGSKKALNINSEMQQKALALLNSDYDEPVDNATDKFSNDKQMKVSNIKDSKNTAFPSLSSNMISSSTKNVNAKEPNMQDPKVFTGFKTASGRNVPQCSEEAFSKAKKLLLASQSSDQQNDEATEKQPQRSQQIQYTANNTENNVSLSFNTFSGGGFMTASGHSVPPTSDDALRKAQKLLLSSQSSPVERDKIPKKEEKEEEEEQSSITILDPICGEKRPTEDNHYENDKDINHDDEDEHLQFKYEDLMSSHGGFMKANSKTLISVSTAAKQRAVALFNSSETTRELTQASQSPSSQRQSQPSSPLREDSFQQSPLQQTAHFSLSPLREDSFQQSQQSTLRETHSLRLENIPTSSLSPSPISSPKTIQKSPERLPPLPPHPRKRLKRRSQATMLKMKPFKSPVIQSNIELTKAAASGKLSSTSVRCKGKTVFSMKANSTRYSLSELGKPLQFTMMDLKDMKIDDEILQLTANNAIDVRFSGRGPKDAREAMLKAGASEQFVSMIWVENHYRWILWKIACMIRSYPTKFKEWWCLDKVVEQLLYRYEREVNLGHRPVLKRIYEHDDTPAKHMVLVIAGMKKVDHDNQDISHGTRKYESILTDGWYQINAVIDPRMERAIENSKLTIGSKLSVCGAQMSGDSQPRSPLSTSSNDTYLSITTNASRIASWDTKLGYQQHRLVFRSLSTIYEDGGLVTALDVIVCRKYPLMYTETLPGSKKKIKRTAREEEEVRKRMGTEIHQSMMDEEQFGWAPRFHEHGGMQLNNLQRREKSFIGDDNSFSSSSSSTSFTSPLKLEDRIVSAHFKMQLCDYHSPSLSGKNIQQKMASLLLLNANELNHMDIHEGSRYRIFFTMPYTLLDKSNNNKSTSILYLKTTHKTRWENVSHIDEEKLKSTLYIPRFITTTGSLDTLEKGSEIDIAVLVLHFTCSDKEVHTQEGRTLWYQTLLVVDPSRGLCQVKLKLPHRPVNGLEGQVIGFTNLIYEAHDPKYTIYHLRANDHSEIFIKQKAPSYMQQAILHVRQWIQNNSQEIQTMKERVNQILFNQ